MSFSEVPLKGKLIHSDTIYIPNLSKEPLVTPDNTEFYFTRAKRLEREQKHKDFEKKLRREQQLAQIKYQANKGTMTREDTEWAILDKKYRQIFQEKYPDDFEFMDLIEDDPEEDYVIMQVGFPRPNNGGIVLAPNVPLSDSHGIAEFSFIEY